MDTQNNGCAFSTIKGACRKKQKTYNPIVINGVTIYYCTIHLKFLQSKLDKQKSVDLAESVDDISKPNEPKLTKLVGSVDRTVKPKNTKSKNLVGSVDSTVKPKNPKSKIVAKYVNLTQTNVSDISNFNDLCNKIDELLDKIASDLIAINDTEFSLPEYEKFWEYDRAYKNRVFVECVELCPICNTNKCRVQQIQTRSADEGFSAKILCINGHESIKTS